MKEICYLNENVTSQISTKEVIVKRNVVQLYKKYGVKAIS